MVGENAHIKMGLYTEISDGLRTFLRHSEELIHILEAKITVWRLDRC